MLEVDPGDEFQSLNKLLLASLVAVMGLQFKPIIFCDFLWIEYCLPAFFVVNLLMSQQWGVELSIAALSGLALAPVALPLNSGVRYRCPLRSSVNRPRYIARKQR